MLQRLFYVTVRQAVSIWLKWRFRIRVYFSPEWPIRPPYLVLANHVNYWDPFIVGISLPDEVRFVAADSNFRSRFMRLLLGLVRAVAKTKARTDMESVRTIRDAIHDGAVVAIFPEGQRTWDGTTRPILPGTAKLVRLLRVPVVCPVLKGAYFSTPRWSPFLRRGKLEVHVDVAIGKSETGHLSVSEIEERIVTALSHDEYDWQRRTRTPFLGSKRAEYAEQAFFWCPACGSFGEIVSRGNTVRCRACNSGAEVNAFGFLVPSDSRFPVTTFRDWNLSQLDALKDRIGLVLETRPQEIVAWIDHVAIHTGHRSKPMRVVANGRLLVTATDLILEIDGHKRMSFPIRELSGVNIQFSQDLEFYWKQRLFVIRPAALRASAYWIEQAILFLRDGTKAVY